MHSESPMQILTVGLKKVLKKGGEGAWKVFTLFLNNTENNSFQL